MRATATLLVVVAAGCTSGIPRESGSDRAGDSAAVAALVRERLEAATAGDTARWHRGVSDSALWTGPALHPVRTRDVIPVIAANRQLQPAPSEIHDLQVVLFDGVAQATYIQLVPGPSGLPRTGKRFRKTDVYQRRDSRWVLVGATEISVPFRTTRPLSASRQSAIAGEYILEQVDTLTLIPADSAVQLKAADGSITRLLIANDSTLFEEGDPGEWIVPVGPTPASTLLYRMAGANDVVLHRKRTQ